MQRVRTDSISCRQLKRVSNGSTQITLMSITCTAGMPPRELQNRYGHGRLRETGKSALYCLFQLRAWRVCEALWTSEKYGLEEFVCVQPLYNIVESGSRSRVAAVL